MSRLNSQRTLKLPLLNDSLPSELFGDLKLISAQRSFKAITNENNEIEQFKDFSPTQKQIVHSMYKKDEKFFGEDFFTCVKRNDSVFSQNAKNDSPPIKLIEIQAHAAPTTQDVCYRTFRNKKLANLFDCLMKIFMQDKSAFEKRALSKFEGLLLMNIIQRKFGLTEQQNLQTFLSELCRRFEGQIFISSTKRKEENIKFIYKMILKKMKRIFEEQNALPKDENDKFYRYYFSEMSDRLKIPILDFYDPSNNDKMRGKANVNCRFKSINTEFLNLVFKSAVFKQEFRTHLLSPDFLKDYQKKLHKKIDKLLIRWSKIVDKLTFETLEDKVGDYFRKSVRCKLPWSVFEVVEANRYFSTLI